MTNILLVIMITSNLSTIIVATTLIALVIIVDTEVPRLSAESVMMSGVDMATIVSTTCKETCAQ